LLNVLAGEVANGTVKGAIRVNGKTMTRGDEIKQTSCFVFQDDVILDTMTVREAIGMSAKLRLPDSISAEDKARRVEDLISLLRLEKCADTLVGSTLIKGISGGERKRTALAMEMVTHPGILFLDEPVRDLSA
jgi:ATP-binding cassette subfamily G (WHITE) protein 1